mgnify:FL=1
MTDFDKKEAGLRAKWCGPDSDVVVRSHAEYPLYYDKDGSPLDWVGWCVRMEDHEYKRVARDEIGDVHVSTVWLGMNHSFSGKHPLIFETMIFGGPHDG